MMAQQDYDKKDCCIWLSITKKIRISDLILSPTQLPR